MAQRINDSDYYKNLVATRANTHATIMKALTIVREFIIEKGLILVGGTGIDMALRLKGSSLYDDDEVPDYDVNSPRHAEHAYELGKRLCAAGFERISCIQASHLTTMKVRIAFVVVCDITYCPLKMFGKIPVLNYNGIRVIHPHYQMIDMHSALGRPFDNPGWEVIFERWKKDMVKYDLLYEFYPVVADETERRAASVVLSDMTLSVPPPNKDKYKFIVSTPYRRAIAAPRRIADGGAATPPRRPAPAKQRPTQEVVLPLSFFAGACICGWGAVDYEISGGDISLRIPRDEPISIASVDYTKFTDGAAGVKYYSEYFGKLPRRAMISGPGGRGLEIFDTFGILVGARLIDAKHNVYVCNLQWAMVYLLMKIFTSESRRIVFAAEEYYLRCRDLVAAGAGPTIEVYGCENFTHGMLNARKIDKERIYGIRAPRLLPVNLSPKPPLCAAIPAVVFDPEKSEYFITDGRELPGFVKWELDPYPAYGTSAIKPR